MDKFSYAFGLSLAKDLQRNGVENLEYDSFAKGLKAIFENTTPELTMEEANNVLQQHFSKLQEEQTKVATEAGKIFLAENSKRDGVVTLASGLQYQIIKEADGAKPTKNDKVKVHYHGMLIDGRVFDSSVDRGEPASFGVTQVIPGWVEALQLMPVGSKWKLFIPSELAYGERGAGQMIAPNSTLIFDVELLEIL